MGKNGFLRRLFACAVAVAGITMLAVQAQATILVFDQDAPHNPTSDGALVPAIYGDNVTSTDQAGFAYGEAGEGFTPNVTTSYAPGTRLWTVEYGDLINVAYGATEALRITLAADTGFEVVLYGFDLGGWLRTDYVIDAVNVRDGGGALLFSDASALIHGDGVGPGHTEISFGGPLSAATIEIEIDASNLGGLADNIGIDNVRFGQQIAGASEAPEPASLAAMGAGLLGLFAARRLIGARRQIFARRRRQAVLNAALPNNSTELRI